jgi:DNA-binding response OmpR family regulator
MPDIDGIELLREVRRSASPVRVIVFSGAGEGSRLEAARQLGADATLTKPFSAEQLLAVLAPPDL